MRLCLVKGAQVIRPAVIHLLTGQTFTSCSRSPSLGLHSTISVLPVMRQHLTMLWVCLYHTAYVTFTVPCSAAFHRMPCSLTFSPLH